MSSLEELFRILKDPTRRRIVKVLAEKGALEYSEIMRQLGLTSTGRLNYHLKVMRELLERDGLSRYRLSRKGILAYQLLKEYRSEEEYTVGIHPFSLLLSSIPALIASVIIFLFMLSHGFPPVNPLFMVVLMVTLIIIIVMVLIRLAYGIAGKPFPYLKIKKN